MKRLLIGTLVVAALFWGIVAIAGTGFSVVCQNRACGYKANPTFGGGMLRAQMTGFCARCSDFVVVSWPRSRPGGKASPPPITGRVWSATSGRTASLFKCPKCAQPVMEIQSGDDLKWCPKCGKASLKVQRTMMFD